MVDATGILFALVAIFSWGSSLVPFKLAGKVDGIQYNLFISMGIVISTLIALPLLNFSFGFSIHGLVAGAMWALGNTIGIFSIRLLGLSKAVPMMGACIVLTSFLWGILFFNEQLKLILVALIGIVLLIIGIPLIVTSREQMTSSSAKPLIFAIITGVTFGSYITPLKLSGLPINEYIFSMVLGILVTSSIIYLLSLYMRKQRPNFNKIFHGISSGFMWTIGNITSLFAISSLGLSIGLPLTQAQLLVATSWGLFYFKESTNKEAVLKIIIGAILVLSGAVLLAVSK